jgi:hypothetical protein
MRKNFTLSIETELSTRMKLQAIREGRDVSTITESLYRQYLEKAEKPAAKTKPKE